MSRKRAIFHNAVDYAVELGHLSGNPIGSMKWRAPKLTEAVNPRVVINPGQARAPGCCSANRLRRAAGRVLRVHVLRGPASG
ncbi:hypothetical protein [Pseudonocardia endophytica]|uniref:hypothetical protein n=1 Tax=Pseudonocardia endophytica TaxID=401976 RepID=UPI0014048B79|nr:hypothetical protein [Pseudonocardia endophytica]